MKMREQYEEMKKDFPDNDFIKFCEKRGYYILDENENIVTASLIEWSEFFENINNRIVKQEHIGDKWISTVFLGLDHSWDESKVEIFETMVFEKNDYHELYCDRYSTWQEALEGHERALQWVRDGCKDED